VYATPEVFLTLTATTVGTTSATKPEVEIWRT